MSDRTIRERVTEIVSEVLNLEGEEIRPSARFFADLGGESIDVLELSFQIERKFGAKIEFNRLLSGDRIETDERGVVKPESLAWVAKTYPFLAVEHLGPSPTPETMKDLLTADAIAKLVEVAAPAA